MQLLKKLSDEDNYIKCKNTALKIIERTYKSEKELAERLELKGYDRPYNKTYYKFYEGI